MAPVTEIATMPLKAGAHVEDTNSASHAVWQSILDTVSSQDGFQRLYWGRRVEAPNEITVLIGETPCQSALQMSQAKSAFSNPCALYRLERHSRSPEVHRKYPIRALHRLFLQDPGQPGHPLPRPPLTSPSRTRHLINSLPGHRMPDSLPPHQRGYRRL